MLPNVRRYVEYSSPTIGGVGAAFAHPIAWSKHEFTNSFSNSHRPSRKSLCQRVLHISFVVSRFYLFSKNLIKKILAFSIPVKKSFTLSCCGLYQLCVLKYSSISPPDLNLYPYRANISFRIIFKSALDILPISLFG